MGLESISEILWLENDSNSRTGRIVLTFGIFQSVSCNHCSAVGTAWQCGLILLQNGCPVLNSSFHMSHCHVFWKARLLLSPTKLDLTCHAFSLEMSYQLFRLVNVRIWVYSSFILSSFLLHVGLLEDFYVRQQPRPAWPLPWLHHMLYGHQGKWSEFGEWNGPNLGKICGPGWFKSQIRLFWYS